tara:strand:- start:275 stop:502 length:228 start_codon:yes stop_codon:yes gene_type:complete
MTNTNCLAGFACPKCGFDEYFHIAVTGYAFMTDDGWDGLEAADFSDNSEIICYDCRHPGIVRDFRSAPAPAGDTQ